MDERKTLVVNFFAGAGAGKTTCAWEVAAELKKANIVTEYVPEYAKELVWDGKAELLDGSFNNQSAVFAEQKKRLDRLIGKVDVIVTDSPLLLQAVYIKERPDDFLSMSLTAHNEYENFNLFINRGKVYEQEGRIHSLEESRRIDEKIKDMLEQNGIFYGNYYHQTIDVVVHNIQTTLKRIQQDRNTISSLLAHAKEKVVQHPRTQQHTKPAQTIER
ncbi:AAA family ATPase (plasmid) [Oscillospiraceae bacterium PP1C4]